MTNNLLHDFKSAKIKHLIEKEFYQYAGKVLGNNTSCSLVTGPDCLRHVENVEEYLKVNTAPTIYETDTDIFIDIYTKFKYNKKAVVKNKSIEHAGSRFIDCDLTCISDTKVIINTLLNQILHQCTAGSQNKVFIFSMSPRTSNGDTVESSYRKILGLLGARVNKFGKSKTRLSKSFNEYLQVLPIYGTKGRLQHYISYRYNAKGGTMYTCLLHYK